MNPPRCAGPRLITNQLLSQLSYVGTEGQGGSGGALEAHPAHCPPTKNSEGQGIPSAPAAAPKLPGSSGALARFFAKTRRETSGPVLNGVRCLRWTGAIQTSGYGSFGIGSGKSTGAHRWICEQTTGPIPPGHEPDHLCRNHWCVERAHLEVVTHKVNALRGDSPTAINARKTHCDHGHPLSGDNLFFKAGKRQCHECTRAAGRDYQARLRRARGVVPRAFRIKRPAFPVPAPAALQGAP